jgi:hypothetical protein
MGNFDEVFESLAPTLRTRTFTLDGVHVRCEKPVVLTVRHAGQGNPAFESAQLKLFRERQAHAGGSPTPQRIEANRLLEAKLLAATVVTGWENVIRADGVLTPMTPDLVEELLSAMIRRRVDMFIAFAAYCYNADNFRDIAIGDPEALGK